MGKHELRAPGPSRERLPMRQEPHERRPTELPVDRVTLMEDRARVLRRGQVSLAPGPHRLVVSGVAPVLVDKSLCCVVDAGGQVRDASVERRGTVRREDRADALLDLDVEIEQTEDAAARLERRLARVTSALGLLDETNARTLAEMSLDAAWSRAEVETWDQRLDALNERERSLRDERLSAAIELVEQRRTLERLRARREVDTTPSRHLECAIILDVDILEEGTHTIEIEYLVPNACWRPYHRATLSGGLLRFESDACVWQNTGEDWVDVELRMSTQRPSLGASPPRLTTDLLSVQKKSDVVHVEHRQQMIETTGLGATDGAATSGETGRELPGIDDGGDVLELRGTHRATVPSSGRPHRAALFEVETRSEVVLFAAPERVSMVLTKTTQANAGEHPILAGPVDLIANGGVVGRTSIHYIAPGERFELGWGPDPALRVHRDQEELDPEMNLLRSWHSVTHKITNKISNLGPDPKRVTLVERVPVSELEKVQIEVDPTETTGGVTPDEDGFIRWTLELDGFSRQRVELRYTLRRHTDVLGL